MNMTMRSKDLALKIRSLLEEGRNSDLRSLAEEFHPAEIAEVSEYLTEEELADFLRVLDDDVIAEILPLIHPSLHLSLLRKLGNFRASNILEEMDTDDAADVLEDTTPEEYKKIISLMEEEDAKAISDLLKYPENTAGSIMTKDYVALPQEISCEEAIDRIREDAEDAEFIYYIYIVNKAYQLVGVVSLKELVFSNPKAKISGIMERDVVKVLDIDDQEKVAKIIAKYDFMAVPVVGANNELVGIVTVDDIIDVLEEEATEDMYKMVGTSEEYEDALLKATPSNRAKARLPWLVVCMVGEMVSGTVMHSFSGVIRALVALTFFVPVIMAMGGNVGAQSSTITVRGLAVGQIRPKDIVKHVFSEAKVGFLIGIVVGLSVGSIALLWQKDFTLGFVVGFSLWFTITSAATVGSTLPLFFSKIGVDPAIASGPFITTAVDIFSLLIYFSFGSFVFYLFH